MNEMAHRGFRMQPISLEKSQAFDFIIEGDTLIPPFISVPDLERMLLNALLKREKMVHSYQKKI